MTTPACSHTPRANLIERQSQARNGFFCGGNLRSRHLCKVFRLKYFAVGHRQPRVDFDFRFFFFARKTGEQRLLDALRACWRRLWCTGLCLRQHRRNHLVDIAALPKENPERLIEQDRMFVPLDEDGMKRPVKIVARTDMGYPKRFQGIEYRAWTDRNSRSAQCACEVEDIFGEAALTFGHDITPPRAGPTSPRRANA